MKFILLTVFLYCIWLTSVEVVADDKAGKHCCLKVPNTKVQIGDILDYDIQNSPPCNIIAIRFHTKKDIAVCWDPDEKWAKRAKQKIDKRRETKPTIGPPKCITSKSTRIQTTAIKTPGPQTKTSSRTGTSISTAPSTVTTLKTTRLRTTIRTMSTKPATVSTETSQSPMSSAKQCTEPNYSTGTSHKPPGKDTEAPQTTFTSSTKKRTTTRKNTPSKIIQRKRGKGKKQLRKYQMRTGSKG